MEMVENKPKVGVCLLSRYGVFADKRDPEECNLKLFQSLEKLDLIAEKMSLDKMLLVIVSDEALHRPKTKEVEESVALNSTSFDGEVLWQISNWYVEEEAIDKKVFDRLEYLGAIYSNGFNTSNISQFLLKDGKPVDNSFETFIEYEEHPENFELAPTDDKSFYYKHNYMCRIRIDRPNAESDQVARCKAAALGAIEYLKGLKDKYDIRQVIMFTDNATYQETHHKWMDEYDGVNMLDSDQIAEATGAPVIRVLNNIELYYGVAKGNAYYDINPVGDGYSGECHSGEFCTYGFEAGTNALLQKLGDSKNCSPAKKELLYRLIGLK